MLCAVCGCEHRVFVADTPPNTATTTDERRKEYNDAGTWELGRLDGQRSADASDRRQTTLTMGSSSGSSSSRGAAVGEICYVRSWVCGPLVVADTPPNSQELEAAS